MTENTPTKAMPISACPPGLRGMLRTRDLQNSPSKQCIVTACAALALVFPLSGYAANWIMLEATEPEGAPGHSGYAAISLEYQASHDTPLLAGAWKGQPDLFNRFAPRFADGEVWHIPIAVAGVHGRLPEGALTYRVAGVAGDNAIVRDLSGYHDGVARLIDASLTWNHIPHARLRVGLFRQPLGEEVLALERRHVNFSHVTQQIVQERYFASDGSVNGDPNFDLGPVSAFRDIGAQLFDSFETGPWEHTYALMLGRGTGVEPSLNHTGIEKYLYWSSERIFGGKGPKRNGLKLYAWSQFGERSLKVGPTQAEQNVERRRAGLGATLRTGPWSLAGEWIYARGMIYHGPDGGTTPGSISNDGMRVAGFNVLPDSKANGGYVDLGYRVQEALELRMRYDILHRGTDSANTEIQFQSVTVGGSYAFTRSDQIIIDYQFRRYNAPRLDADSPTNVLLDGVDDRVGIRFYHQFSF